MRKQLALSTIVLLSSTVSAQAQEFALGCGGTPLLFPKQALSTNIENLDITADYSEVSNGNYLLRGNAAVNSAEYYLSADEINLQKASKISSASGHVKFQDKRIMLTGNKAVMKKQGDKKYTVFEQAKYHYPESKVNGQAQKIVNDGTKQTFDSVTYSLCPVGNTDWVMKANKVTLDQKTNLGVAENVTVEFMGVPIFYSPYHEWVLKGRSSGFLAPSFASYNESDVNKNKGYQIRIPYYFNIAPNRDFLLTLNQASTRGRVIEGKYRQLVSVLNRGRIEIEGHYLDKDKISKEKRWLIDAELDLSLNTNTELNIVSNRVSDKDYFKEIAHSGTSKDLLQSSVNLSYENKKTNINTSIFAENEQLVNNGKAEYTRAPKIFINKKVIGLGNREVNFSILSTKFKHQDASKETGTRTHAQAEFTRDITTNAYSLQPRFNISKTKYSMDSVPNQNRSIYSFGVDSKLFFERDINLFGKSVTQTLTPRLAYNYTQGKDQSALQKFDSEAINFSYENLFSGKKFTGIDRIGKTNDIALGLESDFIDNDTGATYLSLKIAQLRYLSDTKLDEAGNLVAQEKDYSNIVATADLTLDKFTFNNELEYDSDSKEVAKHHSALSYILSPRKFISLTHSDDGEQRTVGVYGAYPVTQKVHLFTGINRSLTNSITNRKTAGIAYESCCYAIRIARFKQHLNDGSYDTVTKFELVLKGLASSDSSLAERLKEEIPNYLANLDK
ncbi:Outer membrane protein Imp, required for envelope biogenesis / Organic solvent tolerance protein precursor [uncultured Candidatus Thioglobus sp.]|nr:Outer membrane protein Imp, required for envelope biogenesis / Organic solvent tolerance protein precursor [uncultured Candidatus Thioglobus sp.]